MNKLTQAHLLRDNLELAPLVSPQTRLADLPEVAAPDLTQFEVDVPLPPPLTEDVLQAAAVELAYANGEAVLKGNEASVSAEDDVLIDLVGYANGQVKAGSSQAQVWLGAEDDPEWPGLRAALNGQRIGQKVCVEVQHPAGSAAESLAGEHLVYDVDILAARRVTPAELDSPELLEAAGVQDVEGLLQLIAESLEAEREQSAMQLAQTAIAEALQARLGDVTIDAAVISAELDRQWRQTEGALLEDKGLSDAAQAQACQAFVRDEARRAAIVRGFRTTLALAAIAKAHGLRPTREELDAWVKHVAKLEQRDEADVIAALKDDAATQERLSQIMLLETALGWVMEQATIRWVDEA